MKLKTLVLSLFFAGCSFSDGCSGHSFTVVLPVSFQVEETAEVQMAGEPAGFVESVSRNSNGTQAKVRVQDLTKFSDADLYRPWKDSRGKSGLRVVTRQGNPLADGMVVLANPGSRRVANEGQRGSASRGDASRDEARRDAARRRLEERRMARDEGERRQPFSREAAGGSREERRAARLQRAMERSFASDGRSATVDTPGARRFQQLGAELANASLQDAAGILDRDGEATARLLREEALQAREAGDIESAKALRRMESQLRRLRRLSDRPGDEPAARGEGPRRARRGQQPFERP